MTRSSSNLGAAFLVPYPLTKLQKLEEGAKNG